jgi:hypothetical protein
VASYGYDGLGRLTAIYGGAIGSTTALGSYRDSIESQDSEILVFFRNIFQRGGEAGINMASC